MHRAAWPVLAIFLLSGVAGLVYEVVWSRPLVLVIGKHHRGDLGDPDGFFGGVAISAIGGGRLADRVQSPLRLYARLEFATGGVVIVTPGLFHLIASVCRITVGPLEAWPQVLALVALRPHPRRARAGDFPGRRDTPRADAGSARGRLACRGVRALVCRGHHRSDRGDMKNRTERRAQARRAASDPPLETSPGVHPAWDNVPPAEFEAGYYRALRRPGCLFPTVRISE